MSWRKKKTFTLDLNKMCFLLDKTKRSKDKFNHQIYKWLYKKPQQYKNLQSKLKNNYKILVYVKFSLKNNSLYLSYQFLGVGVFSFGLEAVCSVSLKTLANLQAWIEKYLSIFRDFAFFIKFQMILQFCFNQENVTQVKHLGGLGFFIMLSNIILIMAISQNVHPLQHIWGINWFA